MLGELALIWFLALQQPALHPGPATTCPSSWPCNDLPLSLVLHNLASVPALLDAAHASAQSAGQGRTQHRKVAFLPLLISTLAATGP